ncbi:MAG TPA: hypothetical protein VLK03_09355 [Nocardioides sp.]|nr:hypothetical protein [Nocardioides sp.]
MTTSRRSILAGAAVTVTGAGVAAAAPAAAAPVVATPEVPLSAFVGLTDDDRLSDFMAWAAAQTMRGVTLVLDEARVYTFTRQQPLYSGFSIRGAGRPQDQARSSMPVAQRVDVRTPGGWFALAQPQTFGVSIQGLSIDGSAGSRLVEGHPSYVLWTSVFRDISVQNAAGVLGSSLQPLLNTACCLDGWWNVNNVRDRAFNLGGSDTNVKPSEMLLDSPSTLMPASGYLMSFESQSKGEISGLYLTAEGHAGLSLSGGRGVRVLNNTIEGRNAGAPSPGALVRITGGAWWFRDNALNFAMTDPAATGRDDRGVVHVAAGQVLLDGISYEKANAASTTTPLVYVASGQVRIRNVFAEGFRPTVRQATEGLIDADDTVTVVTG